MKLGSLKEGGRDGTLIVVSRDLARAVRAGRIAPTLQGALDDWKNLAPPLIELSNALNAGHVEGEFEVALDQLAAPLPRAYEFADGSAYLPHVERVRQARDAQVPDSFYIDPLMYQATSAAFLGPRDPIPAVSEDHGIDLEAELVIVTDDVPMGIDAAGAQGHIQLIGLLNDVSLRNLIPAELAKGFGFVQSKPRSALAPVLVTPDELGDAWRENKLHLPMEVWVNQVWLGATEAGVDMQFDFAQLVAHLAHTRSLVAGTLVGSGTIANHDTRRGASCLAEQRTIETLRDGQPSTPYLCFGDTIRIDMRARDGHPIFGAIEQQVVRQTVG